MRSRSPPRRRQTGSPRARPTRSQTATSTIQLRPWWKSTVSTIPWTASVSDGVEAEQQPLEQLAVRQRVAARVALDAVVGADDHDRRVLVTSAARGPRRRGTAARAGSDTAASRSTRSSLAGVERIPERVAALDERGRRRRVASLDAHADRLARRRAVRFAERPSRRRPPRRPRPRRARGGRRSPRAARRRRRRARPGRSRAARRPTSWSGAAPRARSPCSSSASAATPARTRPASGRRTRAPACGPGWDGRAWRWPRRRSGSPGARGRR